MLIHFGGLWRMEVLRRKYSKSEKQGEQWVAPLAIALQHGHIIFLVGALFLGIAYQPFVYMLVALQIGLDTYMTRRSAEAQWKPIANRLTGAAKPGALPQPRSRSQIEWRFRQRALEAEHDAHRFRHRRKMACRWLFHHQPGCQGSCRCRAVRNIGRCTYRDG